MSANLRAECEKFVPGHIQQKAGEEFALIAEYCRVNNYAADVYGKGDLIESFERKVADIFGLEYEYEMQLSRVGSIDAKVWVSQDLSANFN